MTLLTLLLIILVFVFIIGLCIGSFLNVVILRAFSNESIVLPASKCPKCSAPLKWYHNIPVLSYLILKGKCAFCKDVISIQYPIIEFVTGVLFVAIFIKFGFDLNALFIYAFTSLFIVLAVCDIREKVIFDYHAYILVALGLIYNFFNIGHLYLGDTVFHIFSWAPTLNNSFIASLLGVILGVVIMETFARFGYLVAGTRAFGEGDSYIAAGLGAIFGWQYLLSVLFYGFVIQLLFTIPVFIKKLVNNKDYRTMVSFWVFFVLIILTKWIDSTTIVNNLFIYGAIVLLLLASGIYTCKRVLAGVKTQEGMTFLPFGPALVLGGFILFFLH